MTSSLYNIRYVLFERMLLVVNSNVNISVNSRCMTFVKRALLVYPDCPGAVRLGIGLCRYKLGQFEKARQAFQRSLQVMYLLIICVKVCCNQLLLLQIYYWCCFVMFHNFSLAVRSGECWGSCCTCYYGFACKWRWIDLGLSYYSVYG